VKGAQPVEGHHDPDTSDASPGSQKENSISLGAVSGGRVVALKGFKSWRP
jgi:hypothetical protein